MVQQPPHPLGNGCLAPVIQMLQKIFGVLAALFRRLGKPINRRRPVFWYLFSEKLQLAQRILRILVILPCGSGEQTDSFLRVL